MPVLRLAYATQFVIALIAVFVLWSEVGGQVHLDLMPWYFKLAFGAGGRVRHGESHRGRGFARAPVERPDAEVAGDHVGAAGGLRPGQLLLPHVPGERRGRRPAGKQPDNRGRGSGAGGRGPGRRATLSVHAEVRRSCRYRGVPADVCVGTRGHSLVAGSPTPSLHRRRARGWTKFWDPTPPWFRLPVGPTRFARRGPATAPWHYIDIPIDQPHSTWRAIVPRAIA